MNRNVMKRGLLFILCSFFFTVYFTCFAIAKDIDYPTKPVTFMIPFGAGGTTDLTYRGFIDAASKYLGQPIVAMNKPGAGGTIAAMAVQTAKPDGYTLGGATSSNAFAAPNSPDSPYKNLDGFELIMNLGNYVYPLIVRGDSPWNTWKEFSEWAKKNPKGAKIGLPGARSVVAQGLVLSKAEELEKAKFTYISFKSSAEILTAILGGHINMYGSTLDGTVVEYIKQGKLRLLAFADVKAPGFDNYPTLKEIYNLDVTPNLKGVWGPKGLPEPIIKKLEDVFAKTVKDSDFISVMHRFYMPVVYMNREEVNKYVQKTLIETSEMVKKIRAEETK